MVNYSIFNMNLKRGLLNFFEKYSKAPVIKFICNMIFGILVSKSDPSPAIS